MKTHRPYLRFPIDIRRVVGKCLGDAEVDELQVTLDENEVGRLQIA
jgi:hypothetical protein